MASDFKQTTAWEVAPPNHIMSTSPDDRTPHPTQKPIELWAIPLRNHTQAAELLYEPFAGSGSGLIACERLERQCAAIELNPAYAAVILQRWADATGLTPRVAA